MGASTYRGIHVSDPLSDGVCHDHLHSTVLATPQPDDMQVVPVQVHRPSHLHPHLVCPQHQRRLRPHHGQPHHQEEQTHPYGNPNRSHVNHGEASARSCCRSRTLLVQGSKGSRTVHPRRVQRRQNCCYVPGKKNNLDDEMPGARSNKMLFVMAIANDS